jgi:hypothetical protein
MSQSEVSAVNTSDIEESDWRDIARWVDADPALKNRKVSVSLTYFGWVFSVEYNGDEQVGMFRGMPSRAVALGHAANWCRKELAK